jgi:hypothetical protein
MGYTGVCIASSLQFCCRLAATIVFMKKTKNEKIAQSNSEPFFTKVTVTDLKGQLKICI